MPKYRFDEKPNTIIRYEDSAISDKLMQSPYSCIIGPNNTGKSFVLKSLVLEIGETATYLGPARYNNFNSLAPYSPQPNRRSEWFRSFRQNWTRSQQNLDNSPFNVQQAIAELDDERRERLFSIVEEILGAKLSLELAHPENEMSQRYISCNGHNFSFSSSGVRLVVSIITSLLDSEYTHFLIDEPELGVSPQAQGQLADFLFDRKKRDANFPHAQTIVFATHSSLFLDRTEISNNFVISKKEDEISIEQLESLTEFNQIHFSLLGNRLESLFLPSAILFVEGPTEEEFIRRVIETRHPDLNVSIVNATNDSEMKRYAHMMRQIFPDLQHSPYKNRIIPILDSVHGSGIVDALKKKGIPESQIVTWSKNGIEYYYPEELLLEVFGGAGPLSIIGDEVTRCGVTYRKMELAKKISSKLTRNAEYPKEFEDKFLAIIDKING